MFSPSAKNWIAKYFTYVDSGEIVIADSTHFKGGSDEKNDEILHFFANHTGLTFGSPTRLIFSEEMKFDLTQEEKLKVLLFEALIIVYIQESQKPFNENEFIACLCRFYTPDKVTNIYPWLSVFYSDKPKNALERLFSKRIKIKSSLKESNFWLNYLSNSFVYLDVIMFSAYLRGKSKGFENHSESYALQILQASVFAAKVDDKIDVIDYKLISYFISSAGISEQNETIINELIKNNEIKLSDCYFQRDNTLLSYYVFDVATFMLETTNQRYIIEHAFHLELGTMLGLNQAERESSISQCKAFIMQYTPSIELLTTSSESKMVYSNLSKRYLKILGRNKDKFLEEVKESKELLALVKKSMHTELTIKEKEIVKTQFKDILKTMPSLAIFLIPGGSLLLPLILKLVPDLLPSAFKSNEIEEKD
jgi:hypothetical protein